MNTDDFIEILENIVNNWKFLKKQNEEIHMWRTKFLESKNLIENEMVLKKDKQIYMAFMYTPTDQMMKYTPEKLYESDLKGNDE